MRTVRRGLDAGTLDGAPDQLGDGAAGRQRAKRRMNPQEDMVVINLRAVMDEIMQHGIAGRLGPEKSSRRQRPEVR